jgi:hypothetical protein
MADGLKHRSGEYGHVITVAHPALETRFKRVLHPFSAHRIGAVCDGLPNPGVDRRRFLGFVSGPCLAANHAGQPDENRV